jgi:hypothetical protein
MARANTQFIVLLDVKKEQEALITANLRSDHLKESNQFISQTRTDVISTAIKSLT